MNSNLKLGQEGEGEKEGGGRGVCQISEALEDEVATKLQAGYRLGGRFRQNPNR